MCWCKTLFVDEVTTSWDTAAAASAVAGRAASAANDVATSEYWTGAWAGMSWACMQQWRVARRIIVVVSASSSAAAAAARPTSSRNRTPIVRRSHATGSDRRPRPRPAIESIELRDSMRDRGSVEGGPPYRMTTAWTSEFILRPVTNVRIIVGYSGVVSVMHTRAFRGSQSSCIYRSWPLHQVP